MTPMKTPRLFLMALTIFAGLLLAQGDAFKAPAPAHIALQAFTYHDVTLTGGPLAEQAQFAREFYLAIPNDNLLNGFRLRAGLPAPGNPMGGWYDPQAFAAGCAFGQYVSALARTYANTGDE